MDRETINQMVQQFNDSLYEIDYENDLQIDDMVEQIDDLANSWTTEGGQEVLAGISEVFQEFEEAMINMSKAVSNIKSAQVKAEFEKKHVELGPILLEGAGVSGGDVNERC